MKASDLFVKALEAEKVKYIFGVPGEENLDLLESLRESSIQLIVTRHEQAAGFMAATYGRLTGRAGVCLSTLGPGATNLVTAAASAQLGGMPMVMITGQKPIKTSKQGKFQIIDVVQMMQPLTKFSCQIASGKNIPTRVREAFRLAEEERPGAVHLELPEDIAQEETISLVLPQVQTRRPIAEKKALRWALEKIEGAKHPLLLIGAGANRKTTSKILSQLIECTGIPFFTTQMGKGVVDERHPLYLGTAALSSHDYIHCAIARADLIINVGHDVVEKPPFFMEQDGKEVIHINFSSAQVDPVYFPQLEVVGDIANSLWQIKKSIKKSSSWDFSLFLEIKKDLEEHLKMDAENDQFPLMPPRLVSDVRKALPGDGILALDNGMYKIWFARNFKAHHPNTVLLDNALASMGAGLPSAMAAHMVFPEKKVLAICGDGGFMMNSQELETALRLRMNLTVLILRDNGYGMIRWKQEDMDFPSFGLDFGNPDFVRYAESYGAQGHRVEKASELLPLLKKCLNSEGVHLVEAPVDYRSSHHLLKGHLEERTRIFWKG